MINAKRLFIIVFTCLLSLSINNVYAQNHGSLTIHCHYLDVHNHIFNISQDHIALIKIADYDGNNYHVLEKYSKLVRYVKQNGVNDSLSLFRCAQPYVMCYLIKICQLSKMELL